MLSDRIKKFGLQSNTEPGSDPKTEQPDGAAVTDSTADEGDSAQDKVAGAKAVPSASNDNPNSSLVIPNSFIQGKT